MPSAAAPAAASAMAPHGPFSEPFGMVFCCDTVPSFLPLGVQHQPVDADALLAAAGLGQLDAALNHIDIGRGAVGELHPAGIEPLLQGRGQRPLAVAGGARHRGHHHAGGSGACHARRRGTVSTPWWR